MKPSELNSLTETLKNSMKFKNFKPKSMPSFC